MRWACFLIIAIAFLGCIATPVAAEGSTVLSISASPNPAHAGDVITLNGSITGIQTIAIYLFITGPDLDLRGVTLDNLNIPAGHGLFTTAPVDMNTGRWSYLWDTSVILGDLKPGNYTVHVVSSPFDRLRYTKGDSATTGIEILPSENPVTEVPLDPFLPVVACGIVAVSGLLESRIQRKRK